MWNIFLSFNPTQTHALFQFFSNWYWDALFMFEMINMHLIKNAFIAIAKLTRLDCNHKQIIWEIYSLKICPFHVESVTNSKINYAYFLISDSSVFRTDVSLPNIIFFRSLSYAYFLKECLFWLLFELYLHAVFFFA